MHGTIFVELKKFVDARWGAESWLQWLAAAGVGSKLYLSIQAYPDEELNKIVAAMSESTGKSADVLLEDFGHFIAPDLMALYRSLIRPGWRSLELIENTEMTIHKVVRMQQADAAPPYLHTQRTGPEQITVTYTSARRLCAVARGIIFGVGAHFGETLSVQQPQCMLRGDPACLIVVDRQAGSTTPGA